MFSIVLLPNLEAQPSSQSQTNTNKHFEVDKPPHFDKSGGVLEHTMEPPALTPHVSRDLILMPDAQDSNRTVFLSDYLGHQYQSEEKAFPEQSTQNLSSHLRSESISSKSYSSTWVQNRTSLVSDSSTSTCVSFPSGTLYPQKRLSTLLPKTQHVSKMDKIVSFPEKEYVIRNEQSNSGTRSVLYLDKTPLQMTLQPSQMSSQSNYLNSIVKNFVIISAKKSYACRQCGKRFKEKQQLKRHRGRHSQVKSHKCDVCSKLLSSNSVLKQHMRVHSGEKPFECEVCTKAFSQMSSLTYHKRIHSGEKLFSCEICNTAFSRASTLQKHRRTHTEEKPYMCEVCMKTFSQASSLRIHRRIHTEEKPYMCEICMKKFSQSSHLQTHSHTHTDEKPYLCEICMKKFSQASHLRRHRCKLPEKKSYVCLVCMKKFTRSWCLQRHGRIHLKQK